MEKSLAVSYKTKHITTIQPSNYIPGYLSQSNEDMFTQNTVHKTSLGALFIRARNWKQPRYPLMGEQLPKPCCVYTLECYSAIKRNKPLIWGEFWGNNA